MKTLEQMMLFAAVVENMSYTEAAKSLGVSKGHISQQISLLEEDLGVPLLLRTTRLLKLTEEGQLVWEQCAKLNQIMSETRDGLVEMQGKTKGRLRVTAPIAFGEMFLVDVVDTFIQKYPDVRIDLELANRTQDILRKEFDLAIRITNAPPEAMIAKPLSRVTYLYCAAPKYLKEHGWPTTPSELEQHNCLARMTHKNYWVFQEGLEFKKYPIKGKMRFNHNAMLKQAIMKGLGIGKIADYIVRKEIESKELIQLFTNYQQDTVPIYILYPPRNPKSLKVQYFIEHLQSWFSEGGNIKINL